MLRSLCVAAPFAIAMPLFAMASPARADVFVGGHPKLGKMTLRVKPETAPRATSLDGLGSEYRYSIRKGKIRAYGKGFSKDSYLARVASVRVTDQDNYGYTCHGFLNSRLRNGSMQVTLHIAIWRGVR